MTKPNVLSVFVPGVYIEIVGEEHGGRSGHFRDGGLVSELQGFLRQERITPITVIESNGGSYKAVFSEEDADLVRDMLETSSLADVECLDGIENLG
ncbi:MAG: hypothetical protein MN733_34630 [Nitrososphaera sp.]|nr:hypothetical protein [Nitrososphaera sp.]